VVPADITVPGSCAQAVEDALETLGRLDVLVNNAGVALPGPMVDAAEHEWAQMIDVNLTGLLSMSRAALPHLLAAAEVSPHGVADLVNISSVSGRRAPLGAGVYAATKAGVCALSESLRQEVTARHVRVGLVEPGATSVEGLAERGVRTASIDKDATSFTDIELLEVEDIAAAVVFMVGRPRRMAVNEILVRPTEQVK
jgi:NADP-dependent 3-hydroxy acid dehydrogenase YdfG